MQLLYPRLASKFDRWIKEDDLVLYADLVNDRLDDKMPILVPVILQPFVPSPLVRDVAKHSCSAVIVSPVKLAAPPLDSGG